MSIRTFALRIQSLDVLRAVAVLLVLLRHGGSSMEQGKLAGISRKLQSGAWTGVDVFFVLSGYLISTLLFREFSTTGKISYFRFLARRACRIYPPLWLLLFLTALVGLARGVPNLGQGLLVEGLFLTNYIPQYALLGVTWSLAVEEHFYLILPLVLIVLYKLSDRRHDPFFRLPLVFCIVGLLCISFRYLQILYPANYPQTSFYRFTHHRVDALFFGVLISYFHTRNPMGFREACHRFRTPLIWIGTFLFASAYIFPFDSSLWEIQILGLTQFYLGAGLWLLAAIGSSHSPFFPIKALAWVGRHSYSIYLWHIPVRDWIVEPLKAADVLTSYWIVYAACFWVLSIGVGALFSILVEQPSLKLRDSFFPSLVRN